MRDPRRETRVANLDASEAYRTGDLCIYWPATVRVLYRYLCNRANGYNAPSVRWRRVFSATDGFEYFEAGVSGFSSEALHDMCDVSLFLDKFNSWDYSLLMCVGSQLDPLEIGLLMSCSLSTVRRNRARVLDRLAAMLLQAGYIERAVWHRALRGMCRSAEYRRHLDTSEQMFRTAATGRR